MTAVYACFVIIIAVSYIGMAAMWLDHKQERKAWNKERAELLNRIQARNPAELAKLNGEEAKPMKTAHERNIEKWRTKR